MQFLEGKDYKYLANPFKFGGDDFDIIAVHKNILHNNELRSELSHHLNSITKYEGYHIITLKMLGQAFKEGDFILCLVVMMWG